MRDNWQVRLIDHPRNLKDYFPDGNWSRQSEEIVCDQIKQKEFVLFVGSAISIWEPSSLPAGQTLKDALIFGLPQVAKNPTQAIAWFLNNYKKATKITLNPYSLSSNIEEVDPFSLIRYARPLEFILQCFNDAHPNFDDDFAKIFELHNQLHQANPVHRDLVRCAFPFD